MNIKLLQEMFHAGVLRSATVVPSPMEPGRWQLFFERVSGGMVGVTKARSTDDRIYRRLDGALNDAKHIGFNEIKVQLH